MSKLLTESSNLKWTSVIDHHRLGLLRFPYITDKYDKNELGRTY